MFPFWACAQIKTSTLTVFTEQGDPFYLYLNGMKVNDSAVTKLKMVGLSGEEYVVKVDFKSSNIKPVEKTLYLFDGNERKADVTYRIRKDKNGAARFTFYAMHSPEPVEQVAPNVKVVYFKQPVLQVPNPSTEQPASTKTEQPVTILSNVKGASISKPVSQKDTLVAVAKPVVSSQPQKPAVKPADKPAALKPATPPKPVKQTSKPETPQSTATKPNVSSQPAAAKPAATDKNDKARKEKTEPAYPFKKCNDWPMMKSDYLKAKALVETGKNDKQRLEKAKKMAESNCLLVSQISDMCGLFSDDNQKLEFVKYAYGFTIDRNNYARLEKLFSNKSHIQDFKSFLTSRTSE